MLTPGRWATMPLSKYHNLARSDLDAHIGLVDLSRSLSNVNRIKAEQSQTMTVSCPCLDLTILLHCDKILRFGTSEICKRTHETA
jgi:hypothetical protein